MMSWIAIVMGHNHEFISGLKSRIQLEDVKFTVDLIGSLHAYR